MQTSGPAQNAESTVVLTEWIRRKLSGYRCRLVQFCQKFMEDAIELVWNFHHWRMTTFVDEMKLAVRDQALEFTAYKWRGNGVIITPDQ